MGKMRLCANCLSAPVSDATTFFCSHRCSDAYWHRAARRLASVTGKEYTKLWQSYHIHHIPIDGYPEKKCPGCGVQFKPITYKQIYCCKSCGDKVRSKDPARQQRYKMHQINYNSKSVRHFLMRLLNKKSRGRHLDIDYVLGIYDAQKGRCALSGVEMTHIAGHGRVPTNISIDRIDSSKGYVKGNIQLVCCAVNVAKSNWPQQDFIEMCKRVADKARMENNERT